MKLLTITGQPKTTKGEAFGYYTGILHLAPAEVSVPFGGFKTCPDSTPACEAVCLNTAGHGGIPQPRRKDKFLNQVQAARVARTLLFSRERERFLVRLAKEIGLLEKAARKRGLRPAVRLNGTSDLAWEHITLAHRTLLQLFPKVRFYDYTKSVSRALRQPYHLTFSHSERTSSALVTRLLCSGVNVAVVFKEVPKKWKGHRVISGDKHDLRFKDPAGVIVGLKAKGAARRGAPGFVL